MEAISGLDSRGCDLTGQAVGPGHASGPAAREPRAEAQVARLKEQNKLLTEEVSKKAHSITILDQEKSALIRDLFQVCCSVVL